MFCLFEMLSNVYISRGGRLTNNSIELILSYSFSSKRKAVQKLPLFYFESI